MDEAAEQLVEDLIAVLEGKKTRNEISDLRSIAIFKMCIRDRVYGDAGSDE